MRSALSLKPSNVTAPNATFNKSVGATKNASLGGKLTRQIGTSNLRRDVIVQEDSPLIKFNAKDTFEVFEDPEENNENVVVKKETSENDNNIIHELERKMEEKKHADEIKKFMQTRDTYDNMSRYSEPPSECQSVSASYDDDDCDKVSVASSTFTTTVRASLSAFHVGSSDASVEAKKEVVVRKAPTKEERDDAMFSSDEYAHDIIKYMLNRQKKFRPCPNAFTRQAQVTEEMRSILVDWISDVVKEYRIQRETFHLAIMLIDRVVSCLNVDKVQFQLVGTAALMIAAKYEEIFPPEITEYAVITDMTYKVPEILRMERFLLMKFNYIVSLPTSAWFGACFGKRMRFTYKMAKTMNYLLDLTLIDYDFVRYRPSDIAAAAACFTNVQVGKEAWPKHMVEETGISTEDFVDVLPDLHRAYINASTSDCKSIFNRYCETDEKEVALVSAPTDRFREMFPTIFGAPSKTSKASN